MHDVAIYYRPIYYTLQTLQCRLAVARGFARGQVRQILSHENLPPGQKQYLSYVLPISRLGLSLGIFSFKSDQLLMRIEITDISNGFSTHCGAPRVEYSTVSFNAYLLCAGILNSRLNTENRKSSTPTTTWAYFCIHRNIEIKSPMY